MALFPEGQRSRSGKLGKFQNSAFMLALEVQKDIVPIVLDTWNVIRPKKLLIRDNRFCVKTLKRIRYEDFQDMDYKTLSDLVRFKILGSLIDIYNKKKYSDKYYYRNTLMFQKIDYEIKNEYDEMKDKLKKYEDLF